MEIDGSVKQGHRLATGRITNFDKAGITPDDLQKKIDEYFESGEEEIIVTSYYQGKSYDRKIKIFTLPGLCLFIGLESRQRYWEMAKDADNPFKLPLKKGYLRLQEYFEKQTMLAGNPAGPVFILKNMDYSDMQTVNQNVTETVQPKVLPLDRETGKLTRKLLNQGDPVNEIKQEKIA